MPTPRSLRSALAAALVLLAFPAARANTPAEAPSPAEAVYTVAAGDSLEGIARRFGTSVQALTRRNRQVGARPLRSGIRLIAPGGPAAQGLPPYRAPLLPGPPLEPCAVRRWPKPVEQQAGEGERSACATGPSGARVCVVVASEAGAEGTFLEEGGARVKLTESVPFMGMLGAFEVLDVDLDGDGDDERAVALLWAVSNGLGVAHWSLYLLEKGQPAPLSLEVREYGEGTFLRREEGRGCDVLATEWRGLEDPLRGPGLYFTGHRYTYHAGALVPVGAPVRARRFLREFREGEGEGHVPRGWPARWLSRGWAEAWPQDPLLDTPVVSQREGTVEAARPVKAESGPTQLHVQVRWDGGETAWVKPGAAGEGGYEHLGHLPTRQGLPGGYLPARPEALVGTRVRLTLHGASGDTGRSAVLWLSEAGAPPPP